MTVSAANPNFYRYRDLYYSSYDTVSVLSNGKIITPVRFCALHRTGTHTAGFPTDIGFQILFGLRGYAHLNIIDVTRVPCEFYLWVEVEIGRKRERASFGYNFKSRTPVTECSRAAVYSRIYSNLMPSARDL